MTEMLIPTEIECVIKSIEDAGYEAFLVGGCVRDFLMGATPSDYDVTTNAKPEEIHEIFEKVIDTGIKQGTVTVVNNHVPVEVTTYRTESRYTDGRHPDEVSFSSSLREDLARRDFTMNAIAYNPRRGIVDLFSGVVDIENREIRAVGAAEDRFGEDALRIMRAIRFSSSLDFRIVDETDVAIRRLRDRLNLISRERIQKELQGLLCGCAVERVLRDYSDVISTIIPEIGPMIGLDQRSPYHIYDVWEHTIHVVSGVPGEPVLRLSALFHDIGKPKCFSIDDKGVGHFYGHPELSAEMANSIMRRLKFDNATREAVVKLVRWHDLLPEPREKHVRKIISRVGPDLFDEWVCLKRGDNMAQAQGHTEAPEMISEVAKLGRELIESEGEMNLKTLKIKGRDLMDIGISEGPEIGRVLGILLQKVLDDELPNEREELLKSAAVYAGKQ